MIRREAMSFHNDSYLAPMVYAATASVVMVAVGGFTALTLYGSALLGVLSGLYSYFSRREQQ